MISLAKTGLEDSAYLNALIIKKFVSSKPNRATIQNVQHLQKTLESTDSESFINIADNSEFLFSLAFENNFFSFAKMRFLKICIFGTKKRSKPKLSSFSDETC